MGALPDQPALALVLAAGYLIREGRRDVIDAAAADRLAHLHLPTAQVADVYQKLAASQQTPDPVSGALALPSSANPDHDCLVWAFLLACAGQDRADVQGLPADAVADEPTGGDVFGHDRVLSGDPGTPHAPTGDTSWQWRRAAPRPDGLANGVSTVARPVSPRQTKARCEPGEKRNIGRG